jgi:hypothetical protein
MRRPSFNPPQQLTSTSARTSFEIRSSVSPGLPRQELPRFATRPAR